MELASDFGSTPRDTGVDATLKSLDPPTYRSDRSEWLTVKEVVSAERGRIAAQLHDQVMQSFATCFLNAQLCERLMQTARYDLVGKELLILEDRLTEAMDGLRELVRTLRQ